MDQWLILSYLNRIKSTPIQKETIEQHIIIILN